MSAVSVSNHDRCQDHEALAAQLRATRALLRAATVEEVAAVTAAFVSDLGGTAVPTHGADASNSVSVDISLKRDEPMVPQADPISVAAMRMTHLLPHFMQDARLVLIQVQACRDTLARQA